MDHWAGCMRPYVPPDRLLRITPVTRAATAPSGSPTRPEAAANHQEAGPGTSGTWPCFCEAGAGLALPRLGCQVRKRPPRPPAGHCGYDAAGSGRSANPASRSGSIRACGSILYAQVHKNLPKAPILPDKRPWRVTGESGGATGTTVVARSLAWNAWLLKEAVDWPPFTPCGRPDRMHALRPA